jgi:hypothetical protein
MCSFPPSPPSENILPKAFHSNKSATTTRCRASQHARGTQINRTSLLLRRRAVTCSQERIPKYLGTEGTPCGSVESAAKNRQNWRHWVLLRSDSLGSMGVIGFATRGTHPNIPTGHRRQSVLHSITRPSSAIRDTGFRVRPQHSQALSTCTPRPHWSVFLPVPHSTENTVSSWCNAVQ